MVFFVVQSVYIGSQTSQVVDVGYTMGDEHRKDWQLSGKLAPRKKKKQQLTLTNPTYVAISLPSRV